MVVLTLNSSLSSVHHLCKIDFLPLRTLAVCSLADEGIVISILDKRSLHLVEKVCFTEFCAVKQALNRSFLCAVTSQQSMNLHFEGSHHNSVGLGLHLLQMGLQHKHNECQWSLERRASAVHPSRLFPLHHWREKKSSPVNPYIFH